LPLIIVAVLLVVVLPIGAHPHLWIDATLELELDTIGLRSLRVS
jgi:hypothetical protein